MAELLRDEDLALDDVRVALPGAAELRAVGELIADVDVHREITIPFADDADGDLAESHRIVPGE